MWIHLHSPFRTAVSYFWLLVYLLFVLQVSLGEEGRNWDGLCSSNIVGTRMAGDLSTALATMGKVPGLSEQKRVDWLLCRTSDDVRFKQSLLGSTMLR